MKKKINLKGVSASTWARTIVLIIALVNQFLVVIGKTTKAIDIEQWYVYVSYVFTAISAVTGWWKNNSFTESAQTGDKVKDGEITIPCGENETSTVIDDDGNVKEE